MRQFPLLKSSAPTDPDQGGAPEWGDHPSDLLLLLLWQWLFCPAGTGAWGGHRETCVTYRGSGCGSLSGASVAPRWPVNSASVTPQRCLSSTSLSPQQRLSGTSVAVVVAVAVAVAHSVAASPATAQKQVQALFRLHFMPSVGMVQEGENTLRVWRSRANLTGLHRQQHH